MNKDVENYVKKNEEIELITGLLQEPDLLFLIMDREQKDFVYLSRGIRRQLGITKDGRMADPAQETGDSLIRWLYCRLISWMKGEKSAFCVYNSLKMKNIWLRVQASFPEKGNPARQVFLFSNITGEQEEIEALRGKLEEAERRSREKTRLVSDMSHEFRTPINAIMGMTRLAQASKGEEEKRSRCLEKVENACAYLQELVNDVLDMSRIERGKYTVDQESFSLSHLLAGLKELIETQCGEKQLKLTFIMEQVVHGSLTGDELGLRRVFLNLLSNAVKYTPEGGQITFGVKEEAYNDGTAHFLFWVRDSGIGISPGFMAHLFEPFQRERKDGNVEGTGLGLIISKSIVEVMGGRIWAESEEGKGSCFFVELSLGTAGTETEMQDAPKKSGRQKWEWLAGSRILLVEDNPLNREIEEELLKLTGARVETASGGKEGLDRYLGSEPGSYDVILMDIRMPGMNGYDTVRQLRASGRPDALTIPVIAMTADVFAEDIQAALEAGMNDHLAKPVDMDRLEELLAAIPSDIPGKEEG